jgi:hypothetical protein
MTDPIADAARFLAAQLDWLRHATDAQGGAYAVDVFSEIGDCARRMRSLVDGPAPQRYLGPCGAPLTEIDEIIDRYGDDPPNGLVVDRCDGDVYGPDGGSSGRCRTCGATVDQQERRAWLDGEVRQYSYTAAEIGA